MKIKINPLDKLVSEVVRRRAIERVAGCEYCLTPYYDKTREDGSTYPAWQQLQATHFIGRGNHAVRYDLDNLAGGCFHCHTKYTANPIDFAEWIKNHLGEEGYDLLLGRARITWPKPDKQAITIYMRQMLQELEEEE